MKKSLGILFSGVVPFMGIAQDQKPEPVQAPALVQSPAKAPSQAKSQAPVQQAQDPAKEAQDPTKQVQTPGQQVTVVSRDASTAGQSVAPHRAANIGDTIFYRYAIIAIRTDANQAPIGPDPYEDPSKNGDKVTVPAGTTMTCISIVSDGNDYLYYCIVSGAIHVGESDTNKIFKETSLVSVDDVVVFKEKNLLATPPYIRGFTYGILYVPFKFHWGSIRDLSTGSSVGGYAGFKTNAYNNEINYVIFAGITSITVQQNINNTVTNQNITGFSWGGGSLLNFAGGSFHGGAVIGLDYVSSSANYRYNGQPWIAIELGFDFSKPK